MANKNSKMWVSALFLIGIVGCLGIYYVSGPALQARQVLTDIQRYQKGNSMAPSVAQLRDQSAMYRNLKGRCPCYIKLDDNHFKLEYINFFGQRYIFKSNESAKWVQFKSK